MALLRSVMELLHSSTDMALLRSLMENELIDDNAPEGQYINSV